MQGQHHRNRSAGLPGKIRARITIPADTDKDTVLSLAKENATVHSFIDGKQIVKEIYVPGKLVNIVAK